MNVFLIIGVIALAGGLVWLVSKNKKKVALAIFGTALAATIPLVPTDMEWLSSYETVAFYTTDGDLGMNEYAVKEDGKWFVRDIEKDIGNFAVTSDEGDIKDKTEVFVKCSKCAYYSEFRQKDSSIIRVSYNQIDYKNLGLVKNYQQPKKQEFSNIVSAAPAVTSTTTDGNLAASSISFSHTISSGEVLHVQAADEGASGATGVTFNSDALVELKEVVGGNVRQSAWYIANPDVGTYTMQATFFSTDTVFAGAFSISGVDSSDGVGQIYSAPQAVGVWNYIDVVATGTDGLYLDHIADAFGSSGEGEPHEYGLSGAMSDTSFCYSAGTALCYLGSEAGNHRMGFRSGANWGSTFAGWRFLDIDIDQGQTIDEAYFFYTAWDTDASTDNVFVWLEDVDDCATFSTTEADSNAVYNKATTTASVAWTLPNQSLNQIYSSPNIASVIQEVVDRGGWVAGNDMCIIISNDDATENHNAKGSGGSVFDNGRLIIKTREHIYIYTVGTDTRMRASITTLDSTTNSYSIGWLDDDFQTGGNYSIIGVYYLPESAAPANPATYDLWIKEGELQIKDGVLQIKN